MRLLPGLRWIWILAAVAACRSPRPGAPGSNAGASAPTATSAHPDAPAHGEQAEGWHRARTLMGAWDVSWRAEPTPVPVNRPFALEVCVAPAHNPAQAPASAVPAGLTLAFDAGMPAHGHGMQRLPRVLGGAGGRFRVEGVLFHMPGAWTLVFDVGLDGVSERATDAVEID